jgi:hypothetical protein
VTDQEIIDKAVEKAMLVLPEVVGNLITQHVTLSKLNSEFYSSHPEFKDKKDIVASVIEMLDGENPLMDYKDLLAKAVPRIRERIADTKDLNVIDVSPTVNRDFKAIDLKENGEI